VPSAVKISDDRFAAVQIIIDEQYGSHVKSVALLAPANSD
jgi:hypothetical protein